MRPTSRAHRPAALTTCSARTVPLAVTTSQVRSGLRTSDSTRVWRWISAPSLRAERA